MKLAGYLHVHSTYSYDGKVSFADLKKGFVARGIQFVCMTEHTDWLTQASYDAFVEACHTHSDEQILFIPGLEVSFPDAHVIVAGISGRMDLTLPPLELVRRGHEDGAFIVFAHPHRSRFTAPEGVEPYLHAIEIWNGQYDGKRVPRPAAWAYRDRLAILYPKMRVTAGPDLHRWSHLPSPCLEVEVEERSSRAILQALHTGRYALKSARIRIGSTDTLAAYPHPRRLALESAVTLHFIRCARWIHATLKRFNIRVPKKLMDRIRSRV